MFDPRQFIKETFVYGLATVVPRVLNFLLVPLHTQTLPVEGYAENTAFYVYAAFFNILLTYGMETSFFRFFSHSKNPKQVVNTATITLAFTTLLVFSILFLQTNPIAEVLRMAPRHFSLLLGVLLCDTLVVLPFAYLRATGKVPKFTFLKLSNVCIYATLNVLFLWWFPLKGISLPWGTDPVQYVFISNLLASAFVLLFLLPFYFQIQWNWHAALFRKMLGYGAPIMLAGIAFVINENLDKLLIRYYIDDATMGAYSGCYKLAVFMTLFVQAFRLGAEPFFFNYAQHRDAPKVYALIMKYFVLFGGFLLLTVGVGIEPLKEALIRRPEYWVAIDIVPIILLANLFLGIYHNLSVWYKLTDRTSYGMYISLAAATATILLNIWLIPFIGFMGAAWATLLAYGCMALASYVLGKKHYPIPYPTKRILGYLVLSAGLCAVHWTKFSGQLGVGALFVFVFLSIGFFMERRELKQLFRL